MAIFSRWMPVRDWANWSRAGFVVAWFALVPDARAQSPEGIWRLADNPYRSRIELTVSGTSFYASVGCTAIGLARDAEGRPMDALVHETPCFRDERRDRAANAYWNRIVARISTMRSVELKGRRLLLTSADGKRLVFVRVRSD